MSWIRCIALVLLLPLPSFGQSLFRHRLNWEVIPEATGGYKVYRSVNNAPWLLLMNTTNQTALFTNSSSGLYKYRITGINSFGEGLPSNEVGVDMRNPRAATNLTLTVEIIIGP